MGGPDLGEAKAATTIQSTYRGNQVRGNQAADLREQAKQRAHQRMLDQQAGTSSVPALALGPDPSLDEQLAAFRSTANSYAIKHSTW